MSDKKLEALAKLNGKKANEITAEELAAANTELQAEGFEHVQLSIVGSTVTKEERDTAVSELTTAHTAAMKEKTDIIALRDARITELEGVAAGDIVPGKKDDKAQKEKEGEKSNNEMFKERAAAQSKETREKANKYNLDEEN